ncbi:2-amino-4-hydroxy-6-hydroxymethyldihydropteridine diphosphokinase [Tropicimonas sp.]|uniref:2-amino-4-hydroxy-6- hydroxymethyldihydropteridine diphosphokinase n=1 Tax=Tropicimonas sp. TaxID=2067044 RepID=UPI003A842D68
MPQDISRHNSVTKSLISLGANVISPAGAPARTVRAAFEALEDDEIVVVSRSRLFATPCMPAGAGPDYVNAAALITSSLPAAGLLDRLHRIEARFERRRDTRWGARTLDIDLLDHGGQIAPDLKTWWTWHDLPLEMQMVQAPDRPILPHPRIQDRAFALLPLADVAPGWRHPVLGLSVAQMRARLTAGALSGIAPIG